MSTSSMEPTTAGTAKQTASRGSGANGKVPHLSLEER